jgi:hypothetical protein
MEVASFCVSTAYRVPQLPTLVFVDNLPHMGKRSGIIDHEEGLASLSLAELDREIARCRTRVEIAVNNRQRKQFESRIHWLESYRHRHHAD